MNKADLKLLIKEIIKEEFLDEMTSTAGNPGGAGPISTPNAFSGKSKKTQVSHRGADLGDKSMPKPSERETNVVDEEHPDELNEAYSKYRRFKESPKYKQPHSKVSYVTLEMKKMLREVDFLVNIATKLKNEEDIPTNRLWKRTSRDLHEIEKFSRSIINKIKTLK